MHGYHIGIALHQVTIVFFCDRLLGLENAVKDLAFMVDIAFGRIEIFGGHVRAQRSSAKGDDPVALYLDKAGIAQHWVIAHNMHDIIGGKWAHMLIAHRPGVTRAVPQAQGEVG